MIDRRRNIIFEMQCISPNKAALAPYLPNLAERSAGEALAAGTAAKDHDIAAEKPGARTQLDSRLAS